MFLVKTDSSGSKTWQKTFGESGPDVATSVQQTSDGGYIVAGYTRPDGANNPDMFLVKIDSLGSKIWEKTFSDGITGAAWSVQQASDGGYIAAGHTYSGDYDMFVVKTDKNGEVNE
jgi:hypothetical protein